MGAMNAALAFVRNLVYRRPSNTKRTFRRVFGPTYGYARILRSARQNCNWKRTQLWDRIQHFLRDCGDPANPISRCPTILVGFGRFPRISRIRIDLPKTASTAELGLVPLWPIAKSRDFSSYPVPTFFLTVVPTAFLMRIFGKRPIPLGFAPDKDSYWVLRNPPGPEPETMKDQF